MSSPLPPIFEFPYLMFERLPCVMPPPTITGTSSTVSKTSRTPSPASGTARRVTLAIYGCSRTTRASSGSRLSSHFWPT